MSTPLEDVAMGALIDGSAKATLLLGATWAVTRCSGLPAAARHRVWSVVLVGLPWLPVASGLLSLGPAVPGRGLLALWAAGVLVAAVPLLAGTIALWRHTHNSLGTSQPGVRVARQPGLGPLTWGVVRPRILLPPESAQWPAAVRDAAVAHEQAHVARRDWALHVAVWLSACLYWFHPLVWLARREHRRLAELAADAHAVASGVPPASYARALLAIAQGRRAAPAPALPAARSDLSHRVSAVLMPPPPLRGRSAGAVLAAIVTLTLGAAVAPSTVPSQAAPPPHCKPLPNLPPDVP